MGLRVAKFSGSARVSRVGERVLAIADFLCELLTFMGNATERKDCFGATPLQRMRSNGQAFQPSRETRALPFALDIGGGVGIIRFASPI